jgi:translocation and assembly module TamA
MAPIFSRLFVAAALMLFAGLTQAQVEPEAATGAMASHDSFAIEIHAPDQIKQLLELHLELQRYRVLADLSDTEIQSLLVTAQQDASDLLATLGYFSPQILITLEPAAAGAPAGKVVRIDVEPGAQARVRAVNLVLEGAIADDADGAQQRQSIRDLWSLASGEPFSQDAWDRAKGQALKQLVSRRYATGRLTSSRADVNAEAASVDLDLHLDSGPAYQIGSLEITGNTRYSTDLVKRFARLQPGDDYVQSNLVEAQQRLTDSGYYDSAYLTLDLGSDPAHTVVRAQLKEASMQKAVFGIGASTDTGARLSVEHTYNQVPGIDWRAVNKLTVSRDTQTFASDWTSQPNESRWRWAASALLEQDAVALIDLNTQRYRFGRFTTDTDLDQNYFLQFEHTEAAYREIAQNITNEAASANYSFALRRFDSTPFPSSGWGVGGELSAGTVLGTKQEPFTRVLLHGRIYQPLGNAQGNLFERQHAGRIVYSAQAGGVFVDNATSIPFNQLFLTGGDTTVRGYKFEEIGVTHNGLLSAESGRYLATGSLEWQRPVVRNGRMTDWESAVFIDTGAVANKTEEFSFKVGLGVGARWKSPIGPLQIDLAYGVATETVRLHLNVGFIF